MYMYFRKVEKQGRRRSPVLRFQPDHFFQGEIFKKIISSQNIIAVVSALVTIDNNLT